MRNIRLRYGLIIYVISAIGLVSIGCVDTEGNLEIAGKILDQYTKEQLPGRNIIVEALVESNEKTLKIDAGHFSTDSSGCFKYSLRKVKDAHFYNFCLVGDSDYTFRIRRLGLLEIEENAKFLIFTLNKLVSLKIFIHRKNNSPIWDTLTLSWESNNVLGRNLYPYNIDNYGKSNNFCLTSSKELRWIGGDVISTIHTRVFADERTKLRWYLDRNGKRKEIIDTITCRRDIENIVHFTY